jgi:hypothetical protein
MDCANQTKVMAEDVYMITIDWAAQAEMPSLIRRGMALFRQSFASRSSSFATPRNKKPIDEKQDRKMVAFARA